MVCTYARTSIHPEFPIWSHLLLPLEPLSALHAIQPAIPPIPKRCGAPLRVPALLTPSAPRLATANRPQRPCGRCPDVARKSGWRPDRDSLHVATTPQISTPPVALDGRLTVFPRRRSARLTACAGARFRPPRPPAPRGIAQEPLGSRPTGGALSRYGGKSPRIGSPPAHANDRGIPYPSLPTRGGAPSRTALYHFARNSRITSSGERLR